MKRSILKQIMMIAAAAVAVSCISKKDIPAPGGDGTGKDGGQLVIRSMAVSEDLRESSTETRAGGVETDNFVLCIVSGLTGGEICSYKYSEFPNPYTLNAGDYTLNIQSHEVKAAAWEEIHYSLSEPFTIDAGQTTTLDETELVCKVSNILVSVRFSDKMKELMANDCNVNVKVAGNGLDYGKDETRRGCFKAENVENSLVWEFTGTLEDEYYDIEKFLLNAKAGEHHTLNFDVETTPDPEKGDVEFTFTVNVNVTSYDVNLNVEVEKEHVIEPFDPGIGITPSDGHSLTAVNTLKLSESLDEFGQPAIDLGMNIVSDNGIASVAVLLSTDNTTLQGALAAAGISGQFELATVEDPLKGLLEGFGFPTGDDVAGETELGLSLSGVLPMLFGIGENINLFSVQVIVRDVKGGILSRTMRLKLVDDTKVSGLSIVWRDYDITVQHVLYASTALEYAPEYDFPWISKIPVIIDITADDGIASLVVEIISENPMFSAETLTGLGLADRFDLVDPNNVDPEAIAGLGFPMGDEVEGETSLTFDITNFIPLIFAVSSDEFDEVDFRLTVVDAQGADEIQTIQLKTIRDIEL